MICPWCAEEVLDNEWIGTPEFHRECEFRLIAGSVAHLLRRCSCYVPGSEESDPPDMSLRQAARAAFELWRKQGRAAK